MNNTPLITAYEVLPAIPVVGGARPYQVYEKDFTIQAAYLNASVAGVQATDAVVDAQILGIEVRDGDAVIVDWLTPAELRAIYNHLHSKDGAFPADSGTIPIIHLPDNYPLSLTQAHFGLGRLAEDGGIAKYKITVLWAAVPTIDLLEPVIVYDPTERKAPMGRHFRFDRYTSTHATATRQVITDLFRDMNALACHELWFGTAVGTIGDFTVTQGNEQRLFQTRTSILARELHRAGLTAIAGRTILNFNTLKDASAVLELAGRQPVTITPNWTVLPGAYDVLRVLEYDGRVAK